VHVEPNDFQYMFHHKDPRRLLPLVEHIIEQFDNMDYNGPSSLESVKVLSLFRALYTKLEWKFTPWADSTLERFWREVHSEHDDVSFTFIFAMYQ
jgi:proteasome activator subunit 4